MGYLHDVHIYIDNQGGDPTNPMIWGYFVEGGTLEEAKALVLRNHSEHPKARIVTARTREIMTTKEMFTVD